MAAYAVKFSFPSGTTSGPLPVNGDIVAIETDSAWTSGNITLEETRNRGDTPAAVSQQVVNNDNTAMTLTGIAASKIVRPSQASELKDVHQLKLVAQNGQTNSTVWVHYTKPK